jgi:ribosome maturation factor RimP
MKNQEVIMDRSQLENLIGEVVRSHGYELYGIEWTRERKTQVLRVMIDKPEGIDIDDCVAVSDLLNPRLDEWDPIPEEYSLEVSSPGAERKLRNADEIRRAIGRFVHIETSSSKVEGELIALNENSLTLKVRNKNIEIALTDIELIRLAIKM